MLVQDGDGRAQALTDAGNKVGAELEPSEFSFPKLKRTNVHFMPDFMAMAQIKGMLLSGLLRFFHAGLSCMLASACMLMHSCTNSG